MIAPTLSHGVAVAESVMSCSIEWYTDYSDGIAICEVGDAIDIRPARKEQSAARDDKRDIKQCRSIEVLKGSANRAIGVRWAPGDDDCILLTNDSPTLENGDRLLVFVGVPHHGKRAVLEWVNLSRIQAHRDLDVPRNNECVAFVSSTELLRLVDSRLSLVQERRPASKRGVIFAGKESTPWSDRFWYFIRTADPEVKAICLNQLVSPRPGRRANAIYNLISFPEERDRIRERLFDADSNVRECARVALALLGDRSGPSDPPLDRTCHRLFEIGFEVEFHYEDGDWRRILVDGTVTDAGPLVRK